MRNVLKTPVRRALLSSCLVAGMLVTCMPAMAQDVNSRLTRIENEIQTLSRAVFRGEAPPPGSLAVGDNVSSANTANTEVRLQQIERELRTVTGRVEEQNFESQQLRERMDDTVAKLERRIAELERLMGISGGSTGMNLQNQANGYTVGQWDGGAGSTTQPMGAPVQGMAGTGGEVPADMDVEPLYQDGTQTVPGMGQLGVLRPEPAPVLGMQTEQPRNPMGPGYAAPAGEVASDPAGLYERAFSFLRDRNYEEAEKAFSDFLERYPSHDLAANAKYWLGETFYVRNNFERAARVFAEAYQQYPQGSKGPDNLLKLGMSLAGMGKAQDACVTFGQLEKEYPTGALPVLMRAEKEMEKLDCTQF